MYAILSDSFDANLFTNVKQHRTESTLSWVLCATILWEYEKQLKYTDEPHNSAWHSAVVQTQCMH